MKWVRLAALQLIFTAVAGVSQAYAQGEPHISLQPDMIPVGGETTISGAGFCGDSSCGSVVITLDGADVVSGVSVSADGTFTVGLRPLTVPGRRIVAASQDTPRGSISADALLTVTLSDQATIPPTTRPSEPATPSPTPAGQSTTPRATATPSRSAAASPSSSPLAPQSPQVRDGGGLSWWVWALIGAAITSASVVVVWLIRRPRR